MQPKNVAFRKRTQIAKANRTMFAWVVGVSILFGAVLVGIIFLTQMLLFNERVLKEKDNTISILESNNKNVLELEKAISALNYNEALISIKAKPDDQAIQVVLDALPSDVNSLALGASLQNRLLAGIPGLVLDKLQVEPVEGIENLKAGAYVADGSAVDGSENSIRFSFAATGTSDSLKKVLQNLEDSIRTINVMSLKIESQGQKSTLSVQARAYYEPVKTVELKDKTVK